MLLLYNRDIVSIETSGFLPSATNYVNTRSYVFK